MRTKVAIIGAGPAGLLLGQLLHLYGIDNIILERQTPEYVLGRIRAGLLEEGTVALLDEVGAGARAHREGWSTMASSSPSAARGTASTCTRHRQDRHDLRPDRVTLDLMNARKAAGLTTVYQAADVKPLISIPTARASPTSRTASHEIECDFIAGCDGLRPAAPA